jgi:hypothetical protein
MLKRSRGLGHRRHSVAIEGEIAPGNLIGDEDVVHARPPRHASPVGARVRRPHPLLDVAERVSQDTLRDGRSRLANLSELQELCKDREENLRNDLGRESPLMATSIGELPSRAGVLPSRDRRSRGAAAVAPQSVAAFEVVPFGVELWVTTVPLSWLHSECCGVLLGRGVSDTLTVTE